ncbi:uncharacterized protein [Typha angustifolia]|uniref:uncharacterized protein n=1 Tax=Typha angustifolia TaxID=59011 RepID=UPI003C2D24DD
MSAERSFEAWNAVQRRAQDLACRLVHGFSFLVRSHHVIGPLDPSAAAAVARDAGCRLAGAAAELVEQITRRLPVPFRLDEGVASADWVRADLDRRRKDEAVQMRSSCGEKEFGLVAERFSNRGLHELEEEEGIGFDSRRLGNFGKPQGSINVTSTYDSRTNNVESSLVARGDLWRAEASHGSSISGNESSPLFLVQLGPVLFVRDTTLLFPVHLSKQHLLWYGFDQKSGMHSLCPALWSKHRRSLLMSMICLNPFSCSFMDMQLPNGQLTYVAGKGLTTSAFLPVFGGLVQAQAQYPRDIRVSFSFKNRRGTRITPVVQWPDKSFSVGIVQTVAWKRSGLMLRPAVQFSICPTLGGRHRGLHAELIHSLKEKLGVVCGYSYMAHPSAFASVSIGRSKLNGNVGSSGVVIRVETPLGNVGRPSISIQLNSGLEF